LIEDGDQITIDADEKAINVNVHTAELDRRRASWQQPAPYATRGLLAKYAKLVSSASEGAVTG
jgi:dihydroxy-acid dehydratase